MEKVKHPQHYGGAEDPYEAIKVIHAWGLGFDLGSALKYIRRAGRKPGESERDDLEKALFYIQDHLDRLPREERRPPPEFRPVETSKTHADIIPVPGIEVGY